MMRKGIWGMVLVCIIIVVSSNAALAAANTTKKIGVLTLNNNSSFHNLGVMAADMLTADLIKLKSCTIVERSELSRVFEEQAMGARGFLDEATVTKLGGILGLDYLVMGTVDGILKEEPGHYYYYDKYDKKIKQTRKEKRWVDSKFNTSANLTIKIVDVKNGQIVWSGQTSGDSSDKSISGAVTEAAYNLVREIYHFIPIQGYVIKVEGDKYTIDLGAKHNMAKRDKLVVTGAGEAIQHPVTGQLIVIQKDIAELEVVEIFDTICVAKRKDKDSDKDPQLQKYVKVGDTVTRQLRKKPSGFLGLGWSGKHDF